MDNLDNSPRIRAVRLAAALTFLGLCTLPVACATEPTAVGAADGGSTSAGRAALDAGSPTGSDADAPTYAELYDTYFAKGTPGHCATAGCHADPGHNVWLCGNDAETCYKGMTDMGLINPSTRRSRASPIPSARRSPGSMPAAARCRSTRRVPTTRPKPRSRPGSQPARSASNYLIMPRRMAAVSFVRSRSKSAQGSSTLATRSGTFRIVN